MLMNTNNHILELWGIMESQNQDGLVKRLYDSSCPYHIYATYTRYTSEDRFYGIGFTFNKKIRIDIATFDNLKEMRVSLYDDPSYVDSKLLIIELLAPSRREIFSSLCENLIAAVKESSSEKRLVQSVVNQLEKWRNLFDRAKANGLSLEQQQGLYGELSFLYKFLLKNIIQYSKVLEYWVGMDSALRDFQGAEWAVETKTTATNNPQKVTINGERQLDETLLTNLYLYHCSVEVSKFNGETLPEKVEKVREQLQDDSPALSAFNEKLLFAGYFDEQAYLYANRCYKIRNEYYYRVYGDFPRVKEEELRKGVCEVKYSIVLSMCNDYSIPENELFNDIKSNE